MSDNTAAKLAISVMEAAHLVNMSRSSIFRALRQDLPAIRVGKKTLIDIRDLKSWLDSHKSHPGEA